VFRRNAEAVWECPNAITPRAASRSATSVAKRASPTYTFSVKDTQDVCKFAVFSDQNGLIYKASPLR
jgi:hypothetical protein